MPLTLEGGGIIILIRILATFTMKSISNVMLAIFFILLASNVVGQIQCPYQVNNTLNCPVTVLWESFEVDQSTGDCTLLCGNPNQTTCNPGLTNVVTGGCCAGALGDVSMKIAFFNGNQPSCSLSQNTPVSNGCSFLTGSDSGNIPSPCQTACGYNTWSLVWNSTGITISQ
jgi:hypothetical protein